jgi:hypothetical protein
MGNVEDVRKVIQDFVAPDLKALEARLTALEKEVKTGFEQVEKLAALRHETVMTTIAANQATIMNTLDMERRLARLESERGKAEPQHA